MTARVFSLTYQFLNKLVFSDKMSTVFIIDDNEVMAECIELAAQQALASPQKVVPPEYQIYKFTNAITAISALNEVLPDLIFLDILLDGPDGFSFLNELMSYNDTAQIPVVIITSLRLADSDLPHYGVIKILQKETMCPSDIIDITKDVINAK